MQGIAVGWVWGTTFATTEAILLRTISGSDYLLQASRNAAIANISPSKMLRYQPLESVV